jgi:hypothetical protein
VDSIEWLHDFRSVGHRSAFNDNCPDYPQLLTRVHSWLDPASPEHLTTSDIASLSPPRWLLDQLACGGLSTNDSFDTAKTILHEFRLTCVTNWQSRTPPQTEHKTFPTPLFDVAPPYTSTIWGKGTPGSSNATLGSLPPALTPPPLARTTTTVRLHTTRPPLDLMDLPRYSYQKKGLPAETCCKLPVLLKREAAAYTLALNYRKAVQLHSPTPATCAHCASSCTQHQNLARPPHPNPTLCPLPKHS